MKVTEQLQFQSKEILLFCTYITDFQIHAQPNVILTNTVNNVIPPPHHTKQEAHGPHRSPEKTVQINKHT